MSPEEAHILSQVSQAAPHTYSMSEIVRHGIVALAAGFAHALNEGKRKGTTLEQIGEFIASVLIASFSGVVFGLFALEFFGDGSYFTLAVTGSGGFIGAKGLKFISEKSVQMIGVIISKKID